MVNAHTRAHALECAHSRHIEALRAPYTPQHPQNVHTGTTTPETPPTRHTRPPRYKHTPHGQTGGRVKDPNATNSDTPISTLRVFPQLKTFDFC